jgi:uncharacterized membrane protein
MKNYFKVLLPLLALTFSLVYFILSVIPLAFPLFQMQTVLFLLVTPGLLTLFTLRMKKDNFFIVLVHSIGISIGWMYTLGLLVSVALPKFGIMRPLDFKYFLYIEMVLQSVLLLSALVSNWKRTVSMVAVRNLILGCVGYLGTIGLALMSIIGAFTLNIGGKNTISLAWLFFVCGIYLVVSFVQSKKLDFIRPYVIFLLSLSLLWMLSARSWNLAGWDIAQEYVTAQSTLIAGRWSTEFIKDAYNACLSITILPAVLTGSTKIGTDIFFKYLYPFLFAHFPVILYFWLKKIANKNSANLSVLYVMAQPFYIQPMIALARQEIAFFIFAILMLTIHSATDIGKKSKILLTIFYIFTLVTSHYSTTYVALLLFIPVYLVVFVLQIIKRLPLPAILSEFTIFRNWITSYTSGIKWWTIVSFIVFSFFWYFLVTNIAGSLTRTFSETLTNMSSLFKGDQRSEEVKKAIPGQSSSDVTTNEDIASFEKAKHGELFNLPEEELDRIIASYPLRAMFEAQVSPSLSVPQARLLRNGLNYLKDGLKIILIFGSVVLVIQSCRKSHKNLDLVLFTTVSTVVLIIITFHPTLGLRYNITRIYLQLLVFLSFSLSVGLQTLIWFLSEKVRVVLILPILMISLFYFQGALSPWIGGFPVLHFYNYGTDYEKFYVFDGELRSAQWLERERNFQNTVYGDELSALRLVRETLLFPNTTIIPVVVANNASSYVYTSATNQIGKKAQVNFYNKLLFYEYPHQFLQEEKNRIYSNRYSSIYK